MCLYDVLSLPEFLNAVSFYYHGLPRFRGIEKNVEKVSFFAHMTGIAVSFAYPKLIIIEPRQANLCLRAFRHDKF